MSYRLQNAQLVVCAAVFFLMLMPVAAVYGQSEAFDSWEMLDLINEARSQYRRCGEHVFRPAPPMAWSDTLEKATHAHSQNMVQTGFFAHVSPSGETMRDRILQHTDEFDGFGENIARGQRSSRQVLESWLNSPGHCRNIMNPDYTHVAVSVVADAEEVSAPYWTMKLGQGFPEVDVPDGLVSIDPDAVVRRLNEVRAAGSTCGGDRDWSAPLPLEWHNGLGRRASHFAQVLESQDTEILRGDGREFARVGFARGRERDFRSAVRVHERGTSDFEETLQRWLADPLSCRVIMNPFRTHVGVGAFESASDGSASSSGEIFWDIVLASGTPRAMIEEIASFMEGRDIQVYGRTTCSFTQGVHREMTEAGIEHSYAFFEGNEGPNRDKMWAAMRAAEMRVNGVPNALPYVIVDNVAYTGFTTLISLYRAVQQEENE